MTKRYVVGSAPDMPDMLRLAFGIGAVSVAVPYTIDALTHADTMQALAGSAATLFALSVAANCISASASPTPAVRSPRVGQHMQDGTVYAGISPDTGRPMYTTPKDTGLCAEWHRAMKHAADLNECGHRDWRVPTNRELNHLFRYRAAIGNFDTSGANPSGWYWSSSIGFFGISAGAQRFSDGCRMNTMLDEVSSLRCVRG